MQILGESGLLAGGHKALVCGCAGLTKPRCLRAPVHCPAGRVRECSMPRRPFCKLCPRCRCCPCPNSSGTIFQTGKSFWLWGEHLDKGDLFANLFIFNFFKNQFPKVQHFSTLNFWGLRCLLLSFRSKSLLVTSRRILEQLFQPFSHACYGLSGKFFKRRL